VVFLQTTLDQISIAPRTGRSPPREKRKKKKHGIISNNNKKDTKQRGQGTLSAKEGEGKSLTTSRLEKAGAAAPETRSGKACKSGSGRKNPLERGEDPLPM
jgi:hypothetical protein